MTSKRALPSPLHRKSATRPKIQDVARAAGVSLGTVSAVLNGKSVVKEDTRRSVQEAIKALGYHPDPYARNLPRRTTQVLGVIVSNLINPFFSELAQAIETEAARFGYQIALTATNFSPETHLSAVQQFVSARVAGIAVMTSERNLVAQQLLANSGVPSTFLDVGKRLANCTNIRIDSRGGMKATVEHLLELGHRDLLFLRNSQETSGPPLLSHRMREQGFATAVKACGLSGLNVHVLDAVGPGAEAGEAAVNSAIDAFYFSAVIAVTDMVALGACRGLQQRGFRIPGDVSVVGFDNTFLSQFLSPALTTVNIERAQLSEIVVRELLSRSQSTLTHKSISMPTQLIKRESTAAPNHDRRLKLRFGKLARGGNSAYGANGLL